MLIAIHSAVGVIIAKKTASSAAAFAWAVIFHFILDFIPHGDRKLLHWFSRRINRDLVLSINILDALITIVYLLYVFVYTNMPSTHYVFWAIFGSIAPDFIAIYSHIFKSKLLKSYERFHESIHDYFPSKMTVKEGLVFQLLLILVLIYITL